MINNKKNKKVVIAMSGGVDSSVAAALLKKQGYDIIGVFMKFWAPSNATAQTSADSKIDLRECENKCCSPEAEKRARKVAEILGVPFYVFNFEKEFKKRVVDYFLKEEKAGRTPNPCVVCNKEIKFGILLKKALKLGADYVATGHYARKQIPQSGISLRGKTIYKLLKGKDKQKDQSYFLWKLNQKQLSRVLFPVGGYTKPQVRALAEKFKLPTAETPESQEICFVQTTVNAFLAKHIKPKSGDIINKNEEIIGRHEGLCLYTIGQRKGIKLAKGQDLASLRRQGLRKLAGKPWYVLDKDIKKNNLIVTQDKKDLYKKESTARNINWISDKAEKFPIKVGVKIRYRHNSASALLLKNKSGGIRMIFLKQQKAVTPGQSAVFYRGDELLGGGIIK